MKTKPKNLSFSRGFTLVEILVATAILGVLVSVVAVTVNPFNQINKARNAQRQYDLVQIKTALDLYYNDHGCYPTSIPIGQQWKEGSTVYMIKVPQSIDLANPYTYKIDATAACPQWNILFAKLVPPVISGGLTATDICPLNKLSNCAPSDFDSNYACTYSGNVNCTYLASGSIQPTPSATLSGTPTLTPTPSGTPAPILPAGGTTYYISMVSHSPNFTQAIVNPVDVHVGQTQTMTAMVNDLSHPITSVVANVLTDNGVRAYSLVLTSGTNQDGAWSGSWVVQDTHSAKYKTTFVATNSIGETGQTTISWTDPCAPPLGGDWTVDGTCSFSGVNGVDNGNVILNNSANSITVAANATFAWSPGKSLQMTAGSIVLAAGSSLQQTNLWAPNADGDTYPTSVNPAYLAQAAQPAAYARRNVLTTVATADCNDADATKWQNLTGYGDVDGDTYRAKASIQVCSGASLPAGYSGVAGDDCDDNNAAVGPCIPSGVIAAWPGTNASIPAGWTRVTSMDANYPKGTAAAVDPNVTGGAATHTHTSTSHSHTVSSHSHTGPTTGAGSGASGSNGYPGWSYVPLTQTHTGGTSGAVSGTATGALTWATASNDPSFFTVIYIQSDGTPFGFPANSVTFFNSATAPTGWTQHALSQSKFLKGAAAAGDGGGTGGGGSHAHTDAGHAHTIASHSHTSGTTGPASPVAPTAAGGQSSADTTHTHPENYGAPSGSTSNAVSASTGSTTYQPPFFTLSAIQNTSGGTSEKANTIALYLGTLASIPARWQLCDGTLSTPDLRSKFVLTAAAAGGDIGVIGGTLNHSHTSPAGHTHSTTTHSHSITYGAASGTNTGIGDFGTGIASFTHGHGTSTSSTTDAGVSGSAVADAQDNADTQPPFRTVAWVCLTGL